MVFGCDLRKVNIDYFLRYHDDERGPSMISMDLSVDRGTSFDTVRTSMVLFITRLAKRMGERRRWDV